MAGGIKSKFKFSVPGRSKKQQAQAVNVSGPLSKAQRILGEGGINTGPSRLAVNVDRSWESGSTGDISLSISDSNPSPTPYDGPLRKDRNHRWETEPPISPRKIKSTNDLAQKGLKIKRSAFTVGDGSRDNLDIPKETGQDKRLSSVSMDSHYDPKKMPLAISQQTSNSAMAKGLPPRPVNTGSPVPPAQSTKKKKKPAKLDLSRLRPKGYKDWNNTRDWNKSDSDFEPRYISPPQPIAPPTTEPPLPPLPPPDDQQASVYRPVRQGAVRVSPRSKGITDASGLDRLYHHYEQMSFQHEESTGKDDGVDREHTETYPEHASANKHRATGSTFDHGLVAPSPGSAPGSTPTEPTTNWGHFRRGSHDSKMTGSMTESSSVLHAQSISSRNGYPASVSSRYTRTSKATTSMRSTVESDRQQHSILSLSDSSDDEDVSSPSASASRRGSIAHSSISDHSNYSGRGQPSPTLIHGSTGPRKFRPSLHQLDEHLAVKSVAAFRAANPPANNNNNNNNNNATHSHSLSNHSSASTLTPSRFVPHASRSSSAQSSRHLETPDSPGLPRPSGFGFGIPESRYMPLASAVDRSTKSSLSSVSTQQQQLEKHFSRQSNTSSTARFSHTTNNTSADQPTPPLSPNSVEFYVQSRESLQRDADASSSEVNEARLMAVTKQEEMLLAALRQKRAKMRESASDDGDDDRKSRTNYSTRGSTASTGQRTAASTANSTKGGTPTSDSNPNLNRLSTKSTVWPLGEADQQNILRIHLGNVNVPSSTSVASTSATASTTSTTFDSRNDRILFYLDQPHEDVNTAESSLDFSDDYMEDSDGDDLIANERRSSRMALRRDSAFSSSARGSSMSSRRGSSSHGSQYRKDSIPFHSLNNPPTASRLHDVPEVETSTSTNNTNTTNPHTENNHHHHHNHHTTTNSPAAAAAAPGSLNGDLDTFPQPPMPPPSWPLPTPPKLTTSNLTASTSSAPPSPSPSPAQQQQQLAPPSPRTIPVGLTPESAQTDAAKSKKALVRLSAVGFSNSPMPWWGDDD
ncbi:hypothetical protein GGR50DRAFT_223689 [Xylaria sp. CBS 124048]|nr:hypothetical protein GGR50DRAFT_223689 [Xylaria sp. CBS 124048]